MAPRKHNWTWRRLEEGEGSRKPRPTNYRQPDYMVNAQGRTVRAHAPHPTIAPSRRFFSMCKHVEIREGDPCLVWLGGDTFRVDEETVTTPARFYWEAMVGKLKPTESLYRTCKTPRCVRHKEKR